MRVRRWAVFLIPATLVGLGLLARAAADRAFAAFTRYRAPFTFPPAAQRPLPALSERVVLVLMDGVGTEPSRSMKFLNELRARGAAYDCRIGLPSLSLPSRAVLMTGAWQDIHGQSTNYDPKPLAVEHLFQLARASGRTTALSAGAKAHTLFAPHVARGVVYAETPETAAFERYHGVLRADLAASIALLRERPGFAQVELNMADEAGHGWGAASTEYARATSLVDAALREVTAEVDLERDTLVVTADHGHVAAGGHGGPEPDVMRVPLVLAGRGVRRGAAGTCAQVDIAPTLAVLMGLPLPAASQGIPLLDALAGGAEERREVLANVVRQREAFVSTYSTRLGGLLGEGGTGAAAREVAARPDENEAALTEKVATIARGEARARDDGAAREAYARRRRAALVVVLVAAMVVALFRLQGGSRLEMALAAATALAGVAVYQFALPALGLDYSLTAVNKDEWLRPFFLKDMVLGVATCALAALALCAWARRRGQDLLDLCRLAWMCAAVFCAAFAMKAAFVYSRQDVFPRWSLPDQFWGMAFYLDVLVLMAVGLSAPALALVAGLARLIPAGTRDAAGVAAG